MATTSIPHRWKYDVFVSFRGEDIRKSFMDHLFNDFTQKGIRAFRDDNDLPKGEFIPPQLYKAIEESRFLIVIFSKNYASSTWCLRELVKILKCKQMGNPKHGVRIIFYDVKPDVVRHQTESYAEAFDKHKKLGRSEVDEWKEALSTAVDDWKKTLSTTVDEWEKSISMAANLSGWDLQDTTNGYESDFIKLISKNILKELCDGPLIVGENIVGIDFHFKKLNLSRFIGSDDKVSMIGICGIRGIGKTTLAKAIYNLMYVHFQDGSCFCEDVKEVTKRQGLIQVQLYMIGKILKTEGLNISGVGEGSMAIKQRMKCKRILLVLDDVNNLEQLEALTGSRQKGSPGWFRPGSLIIFTCQNKQLLRSHRVDEIHDMDFLDKDPSLELFRYYAFKEKHYSREFEKFSKKVVDYVQGHPMALKHLGGFLYGKTVDQWDSELQKLKVHPHKMIQQVLRLNYDELDIHQKNILLDIACLFLGENRYFVASVLDGCNCFAASNMQVLVDKSLITISSDMSLQMHDLIQAMAREIVREESITTGKQRRLWNSSEVYNVLSGKKVPLTEAVEVLVLPLQKFSQKVHIDANVFAHMKELRILKIYQEEKVSERKRELESHNVIFLGKKLDYLSNKLSLFYWHGCPFMYLPSHFYPENIVAIDLSYSNIKHFWTTPKRFTTLKVMKLRYCCNLTTTPDFSEITNLEELDLEGCVNLVSVHSSFGRLMKLVEVNLSNCKRLQNFPTRVEMDALQPRWWTPITAPFGLLSKQQHPQRPVSLAGLRRLKDLNLSYCNLLEVYESIGGLSCLEGLYLQGNNFTSLPGSLSQLPHLKTLVLDGCKKLEVLPELPHSLENLYASICTSLREVSGSSKEPFKKRFNRFRHCPKLFIDSQGSITSQGSIHQLSGFLGYVGFQTNRCEFFTQDTGFYSLNIVYHGNSIPEWFTNRSTGNHAKVELPSDWGFNKFRGFGTCVVFKCKNPWKFKGISVKNFDGTSVYPYGYISGSVKDYFQDKLTGIQDSYMIWLHFMRDTRQWEEAKNFVTFCFEENNEEDVEVKECGVRLICDEDIQEEADLTHLSMLQGLPTPTQHGGMLGVTRNTGPCLYWSW